MKTTVVIGFAEALSAPEVAWSLIDAGFQVVAIARRGRTSALRHSGQVALREITPPELNSAAALRELHQLLKNLNPAADQKISLFPLDDTSVWLCSQIEVSQQLQLVGPQGGNVALALDKRMQVKAAQAAGFDVPTTTIANSRADVFARRCDLPLILRPADAVLPKGDGLQKGRNWICATEAELGNAVNSWAGAYPLLVQPFVRGGGEGVFGLATDRGVDGWSGHRRLRMMNPHGSGSSACISQLVPDKIKVAVEALIHQTSWRGLFMVELLRDDAGNCWFVEFNGRPWGSLALSRRQGFEYPAWAVRAALGQNAVTSVWPSARANIICQNAGRELMHLLFILRGPRSSGLSNWPSFWRTLLAIIRPGRTRFMYNWCRHDWQVFFYDTFYTVWQNVRKARS